MSKGLELGEDVATGNVAGRISVLPGPREWVGAWDHTTALWTVGNDTDFFIELVRALLRSCPAALASLSAHLADEDLQAAEDEARLLKNALAELAAKPAYDAALKVETEAREGDLAGAVTAAQTLRREIAELNPAFTRIARLLTRKEY